MAADPSTTNSTTEPFRNRAFWTEDGAAIWVGGVILAIGLIAVAWSGADAHGSFSSPFRGYLAMPGGWTSNPLESIYGTGTSNRLWGIVGVFGVSLLLFGASSAVMGIRFRDFAPGFAAVFALACLAYVLANQTVINAYNLEYALWALLVGLLITNTIGTPAWVRPALRTEFFMKTGLVLLGAEVVFDRLLTLGVPGIFVAWLVAPTVLAATFWFGQRILRIESPSLNMVISADMAVCGVSAAIATAAACKAKKEELSLAIGMSLSFTVIMMVVMPALIQVMGLSPIIGGAWIGGTIDTTGAVAAAAAMLGQEALEVAATVKMIQNILIGIVAFFVAVYWVLVVERDRGAPAPRLSEIWHRFPKFVLGFVAASLFVSWLYAQGPHGAAIVDAAIQDSSKVLRGWFFCLAFVSIGLETNFRELANVFRGGKPLWLYVVGQSLNLCLTLLMAWLMFEVVFPQVAK